MFDFILVIFCIVFNISLNILIHTFLIINDLKYIEGFILIIINEDR